MARLPSVGGDNGQWGQLLNDFLTVEHNADGTLKKAADIAAKYEKPVSGIPAGDLTAATQASLVKADSSVQSVNAVFPSNGNVALTAADIAALPTSQKGAANGVAELDSNGKLPASRIADGSVSGTYRGAFVLGTEYALKDMVLYSGVMYICTTAHTSSGAFVSNNWSPLPAVATPLASTRVAADAYTPGGDSGLILRSEAQRIKYPAPRRRGVVSLAAEGSVVRASGVTPNPTLSDVTAAAGSQPFAGGSTWVSANFNASQLLAYNPATTFPPTDVSAAGAFVRFPIRKGSQTFTTGTLRLRLYSDFSQAVNYHEGQIMSADTALIPGADQWFWISMPLSVFTVVGTGADLTSIVQWRLMAQSSSGYVAMPFVDFYNSAYTDGKARVVIWLDDGHVTHFTQAAPILSKYGFPAVIAPNIAGIGVDATILTVEQIQALSQLGWQVATHAYTNADHTSVTQSVARQNWDRSRRLQSILGTWGGDDFAEWGGLSQAGGYYTDRMSTFRTSRRFTVNETKPETMPMGDPWRMRCYGRTTGETSSAWLAYVDKAITARGLAQICFHNEGSSASNWAEFSTFVDGLKARVDAGQIEVVTLNEALKPVL